MRMDWIVNSEKVPLEGKKKDTTIYVERLLPHGDKKVDWKSIHKFKGLSDYDIFLENQQWENEKGKS